MNPESGQALSSAMKRDMTVTVRNALPEAHMHLAWLPRSRFVLQQNKIQAKFVLDRHDTGSF